MSSASPDISDNKRADLVVFLIAALLYVAPRILGWINSPALEDHDSVSYLLWAEIFRSGTWTDIVGMDPDATPLFPLLSALFSFLPGDMSTAARLVSVLSSVATMVAVYLIAKRISGRAGAMLAVLLLSVGSPYFLRLSWSTLSEPLYIALFSWVVYIFLSTVERPTAKSGVLLGALCGLAFLTRVEAILFLGALPVLHLAYALTVGQPRPLTSIALPNALLVLVMTAIAVPQVVRVSTVMDSFSLNGRSAWAIILANPDGRSYDEKLFSLDYDPKTKNLQYLQTHPDRLETLVQDSGFVEVLKSYASRAVRNLRRLHDRQLVTLVGLPVVAFCIVGFLALLRSKNLPAAMLLAAFLAMTLLAPVLYMVTLRHLIVVVPLVCVFAAAGILHAAGALADGLFNGRFTHALAAGTLLVAIALPLNAVVNLIGEPDDTNHEYSEEALEVPASIIRAFNDKSARKARILSRKFYLAHFSGALAEWPPYTDLQGLLEYVRGRRIDFLFYEEQHLDHYPFVEEIGSDRWNRYFRELYFDDTEGSRLALYAIDPALTADEHANGGAIAAPWK